MTLGNWLWPTSSSMHLMQSNVCQFVPNLVHSLKHCPLPCNVWLLERFSSGVAPANQTEERSVHELFTGAFRKTKVRNVNRACFPKENTRIHIKMGEIHELFFFALSLVWFAGATPDFKLHVLQGRRLELA